MRLYYELFYTSLILAWENEFSFFHRMPPTFWEAAADAILLRKTIRTLDYQSKFDENNLTNEEYLNKENGERKHNRSKTKMYITESDND